MTLFDWQASAAPVFIAVSAILPVNQPAAMHQNKQVLKHKLTTENKYSMSWWVRVCLLEQFVLFCLRI